MTPSPATAALPAPERSAALSESVRSYYDERAGHGDDPVAAAEWFAAQTDAERTWTQATIGWAMTAMRLCAEVRRLRRLLDAAPGPPRRGGLTRPRAQERSERG